VTTKPKPGQRREKKYSGNELLLRCWGPFHDGDWLHNSRFYGNGKYRSTLCKECHRYKYARDERGPQKRLEEVRKWVCEVVYRCGGINNAARVLGVSKSTVLRWLGRYKGFEQKRIEHDSVRLILETLAELRAKN
jgi:hypothetical protein